MGLTVIHPIPARFEQAADTWTLKLNAFLTNACGFCSPDHPWVFGKVAKRIRETWADVNPPSRQHWTTGSIPILPNAAAPSWADFAGEGALFFSQVTTFATCNLGGRRR